MTILPSSGGRKETNNQERQPRPGQSYQDRDQWRRVAPDARRDIDDDNHDPPEETEEEGDRSNQPGRPGPPSALAYWTRGQAKEVSTCDDQDDDQEGQSYVKGWDLVGAWPISLQADVGPEQVDAECRNQKDDESDDESATSCISGFIRPVYIICLRHASILLKLLHTLF